MSRHDWKKRSYKSPETIVRETMTRDKIGIKDARTLIDEYKRLKSVIKEKDDLIRQIYKGEIATRSMMRGSSKWGVNSPVARDGSRASSYDIDVAKIEARLKMLGNITSTSPGGSTWEFLRGNEKDIELFLDTCETITEALQRAYALGEEHGSNLLLRLATGEITISDYDAATEKER